MSRKLILSINEVENGYVVEDGVGRRWIARNPTKLGEVVEYVAVALVAALAAQNSLEKKPTKISDTLNIRVTK